MVRLPESFNSWIDARDVDVVYMNGDTRCFFLLQSTRSVSGHNHDRCRVGSVRLSDSVAKKPISA